MARFRRHDKDSFVDGSGGWVTDASRRKSGDNRDVPAIAAAFGALASGGVRIADSRFRGPLRRPNPGALPRVSAASRVHPKAASRWRLAVPLTRPRLATVAWLVVALGAVVMASGIVRSPAPDLAVAAKLPALAKLPVVAATRPTPPAIATPAAQPPVSPDAPVAKAGFPGDPVPPAPSAALLLSEVSTMDLMMPIAEPDLDIRSRHSVWAQVGKAYGIDPLLLYSVALVESKSLYPDGRVAPTPWLFRVDDHLVRGDRQHVQLQMAAASQFGSAVQDVGIMQVYYPMHRDAVRDPLTLLDPRTNITVGAKILRAGMRRTRDRVMGVGYYHSRTPSLARGYGTAVLTVYDRLKAQHRKSARPGPVAR